MTKAISPLALTAPVAALAVVAATGWAISADDPTAAAVAVPITSAAPAATKDPGLRALTKAVHAERADVRHLEKAVSRARDRLQSARETSVVVAATAPTYSGSSGTTSSSSGGTSGTSGSSTGSGSSGSGGGAAAPQPAPKPSPAPTANTSTGGS